MTDNIYAPPAADLSTAALHSGATFYVVSKRKLVIMSILTMGLYKIYWSCKQWATFKNSSGEDLWPVPRGLFMIFFVHALFNEVKAHDKDERIRLWNANATASWLVSLLVAGHILSYFESAFRPWGKFGSLALLAPIIFFLTQAQEQINASCADPEGESNDRFSLANYAWCGIGLLVWAFSIYALFGIHLGSSTGSPFFSRT